MAKCTTCGEFRYPSKACGCQVKRSAYDGLTGGDWTYYTRIPPAVAKWMADEDARLEDDTPNPINPSHYTDGGIETWDFIEAKLTREEAIGACKANALKYLSRMGKKGSAIDDAGKAAWYVNKLRELLEEQ